MKVLDLFSGIGGFSLGLERAGMETIAFCEIEEYPVKILNKHWPDVPVHRDIRKLDGKQYRDSVDVICGGFPCQPFSVAGKQRGKEDDRHLWPEMLRLIKEVRPTWVIGENVAGFIRMALDDVLLDLEAEGYTAQSFVIPACATGAIHRRDRVWIVAHRESEQRNGVSINGESSESQKPESGNCDSERVSRNTEHNGSHESENGQSNSQGNDRNKEGQNETGESAGPGSQRGDDANTKHSESARIRQLCDEILQEQEANGRNEARIRENKAGFEPIGTPTESPFCGTIDGVSRQLAGGYLNESEPSKARPREILSILLNKDGETEIWKEIGRFNAVQIKEILLRGLHGDGEKIKESIQKGSVETSEKAQKVLLRTLQDYRKAINPSCRWGLEEQQSIEFNDTLQFVSHHIASYAGRYEFKWIEVPTEAPIRHKDDGLSENVARLKALGNAVVPQIPELIGRAIMEIEK